MFQTAQALYSFFLKRITTKMISSDAFDSYDTARYKSLPGSRDCIPPPFCTTQYIDFRSAIGAAYRLSVIAPCFPMGIFIFTLGAHGKFCHTRPFPVIGHGIEDGHAGPAGRAVDERMEIAAVLRIKQLFFAIVTDGDIRRHKDVSFLCFTFDNRKIRKGRYIRLLRYDFENC